MAALLHLKVVRTAEGSKEDDTLLFSDVALGQAKARMQHAFQGFLTGSIERFYFHCRCLQINLLCVTSSLGRKCIIE